MCYYVSRPTLHGLTFKLVEEAEKSWQRIRGVDRTELLLRGVDFKNDDAVQDSPPPRQGLARLNH
jgi:hypothetical protein